MVNYWLNEARDLVDDDFRRMNLPHRYRSAVWDRVPEGDAKVFVENYLERLREMRDSGTGIYLYGPNGHGKTALASIVLRTFRSHGQPCLFVRHSKLIRSAYKDIKMFDDAPFLWELSRSVDVLLVDDFGKAHDSGSGFSAMEFEDLIRDRYDKCLVTLFTSNMSVEALTESEKLVDSSLSVLQGMVFPVAMEEVSQRKQESKDVLRKILGGLE